MTVPPAVPPSRLVSLPGGRSLSLAEQPGAGPPLVLIHGFTDSAPSFGLLLPHLRGRHVIMPDLRGHGGSFRSSKLGLADFASDVAALLDALDLDGVTVLGHSLGALVALVVAANHADRVAGLVMLAGSLRPASPALCALQQRIRALPDPLTPDHPFFVEWHHCEAPVPAAFLVGLAENACRMARADWLRILDSLMIADLTAAADRLHRPAWILSGMTDTIFPPEHHEALVRAIKPVQALQISHCGHNLHWEQPALVAKALEKATVGG